MWPIQKKFKVPLVRHCRTKLTCDNCKVEFSKSQTHYIWVKFWVCYLRLPALLLKANCQLQQLKYYILRLLFGSCEMKRIGSHLLVHIELDPISSRALCACCSREPCALRTHAFVYRHSRPYLHPAAIHTVPPAISRWKIRRGFSDTFRGRGKKWKRWMDTRS